MSAPYLLTTAVFDGSPPVVQITPGVHTHSDGLLVWPHHGSPTLHTRDAVRRLVPGQGIWLPPGTPHDSWSDPGSVSCYSFHVPAGASLALVGASGSGKSTPAHPIAGLGEPDHGQITTGEAEAARVPSRYPVTQETHLFGGTPADNLRIARPTATDDELRLVLREAGADWAPEAGAGLDTVLGDGGTALDEGSVQHLAPARALIADPDVVVPSTPPPASTTPRPASPGRS